jgi:hypothetical protein
MGNWLRGRGIDSTRLHSSETTSWHQGEGFLTPVGERGDPLRR